MLHREILYLGEDFAFATTLTQELAGEGFNLVCCQLGGDGPPEIAGPADRLLILDTNLETPAGLQRLRALKSGEMAHLPVIVASEQRSLTALGLARLNGAEAMFFKPVGDFQPLREAILAAHRKLQHWRRAIGYLGRTTQPSDDASRSPDDVEQSAPERINAVSKGLALETVT